MRKIMRAHNRVIPPSLRYALSCCIIIVSLPSVTVGLIRTVLRHVVVFNQVTGRALGLQ